MRETVILEPWFKNISDEDPSFLSLASGLLLLTKPDMVSDSFLRGICLLSVIEGTIVAGQRLIIVDKSLHGKVYKALVPQLQKEFHSVSELGLPKDLMVCFLEAYILPREGGRDAKEVK
jgi:hypothetical protein